MALNLDFTFDEKNYRHFLNGHPVVMHSHHYLALLTKLAEDMDDIGGPQILADTVESSMLTIFEDYFQKNNITSPEEKESICTEYFSAYGLGKITINLDGDGGTAYLVRSHIDEGWLKKWGEHSKPINHFTRGYVAATFSAIFNRPQKSFSVTEAASMVTGENQGVFIAKAA